MAIDSCVTLQTRAYRAEQQMPMHRQMLDSARKLADDTTLAPGLRDVYRRRARHWHQQMVAMERTISIANHMSKTGELEVMA